jgi:Leucine-rich repeat (LRR) protein
MLTARPFRACRRHDAPLTPATAHPSQPRSLAPMGKLSTLKELDIERNRLAALPAGVCELPHLETLK